MKQIPDSEVRSRVTCHSILPRSFVHSNEKPGRLTTLNLSINFGDSMVNPVRVTFLLLMLAFLRTASAQTPQDARITIAHPGFELLKSDLKKTIDLTTPAEQKQWENIEGYIDTFIIGIDEKREVQVQVLTGINPPAYLICVPISGGIDMGKELRENLDSLGYTFARDPADHTLYSIKGEGQEFGWMRVSGTDQYAFLVIVQDKNLLPQLKAIILKAQLTPTKLADNMIAELKNTDTSAAAITHRIAAFKPIRDEQLETIKQRPDEKPTAFQLRLASARQLLDEAERLMSEADQMLVTLTLDRTIPASPKVNLRTTVSAIAGTQTEATIAQYSGLSDVYASVQRLKDSALSVRVNHPLNEMRQKHFIETLTLTKADIEAGLAANSSRTDAEKEAFKNFTAGVIGVLEASVKSGHLNGIIESIPENAEHSTSIASFVSPSATDLNTILPLLTSAGKGNAVQMNLEKVGDVDIHKVEIAEGFIDAFDTMFGSHEDLFIGVGPQKVWIASGKGGLETLKSTIAAVGEPAPNPIVLKIEGNSLPWVQRIDATANKAKPGKLTADEEKLRRERARVRERAMSAFASQDDFIFVVTIEDGRWVGEFTSNTGLIRFVGKMMSAFSKENFE